MSKSKMMETLSRFDRALLGIVIIYQVWWYSYLIHTWPA